MPLPVTRVAAAIVAVLTGAAGCGGGAASVADRDRRASETYRAAGTVVGDRDGRIVAVRRVTLVSPGTGLAIRRLTEDGKPDESFGAHGTVATDAGAKFGAGASAVAVQRNRKILVFGWSASTEPDIQYDGKLGDLTIVRYRANGRLDRTFGTGGTARTDLSGDFVAGALNRDGDIVVAATSFFHSSALARYRPNGRLDASFGSAGKKQLRTANRRWSGPVAAIAIQRDGKIVVAGYAGGVVTRPDLAVARYLPDGRLDERFGSGGNSILDLGRDSVARALAVDAGDRIVVAGAINDRPALVRYTADGRLDDSFGSDGKVIADFGPAYSGHAGAVVIQRDGKIVASGSSARFDDSPSTGDGEFFALVRYTADGDLDPSFGTGGKVLNLSLGPVDGLTLQSDGKIVAVARRSPDREDDPHVLLTRYTAAGHLDTTFGDGGTGAVE